MVKESEEKMKNKVTWVAVIFVSMIFISLVAINVKYNIDSGKDKAAVLAEKNKKDKKKIKDGENKADEDKNIINPVTENNALQTPEPKFEEIKDKTPEQLAAEKKLEDMKLPENTENKAVSNTPEVKSELKYGKIYDSEGSVNVRSAPGTNSSLVAVVFNSAEVEYLGKSGDWYKIKTTGSRGINGGQKTWAVEGYVNKGYLESNENNEYTVKSYDGILNVRKDPDTKSTVLARLTNGSKVTITGNSPDKKWVKVKGIANLESNKDLSSWVIAGYVHKSRISEWYAKSR